MRRVELLIVGAGAAGITASISAWNEGCRDILLVDRRSTLGGILPQCRHEGFFEEYSSLELTGPELSDRLICKLQKTGVTVELNTSVISFSMGKTAVLSGTNGIEQVVFDKLVLATGCREIPFESLMIPGTRPTGIFTAGQLQEMINIHHMDIGNNIVILGCGDLGMIIARRLHLEGKHVIAVIEKESHHGGMARNYHRCIEKYKIPVKYNSYIEQINGYPHIESVVINSDVKDANEEIVCDTLVAAIGLTPERSLIKTEEVPSWMKLCGNCSRIHDMVGSVVEEAAQIGKEIINT